MRIHWLQHAEHEGLGCIEPWLHEQGHRVSATRFHLGERLPRPQAFDGLLVMGGPMNIYEDDRYPWLRAEKDLINDACVINKQVLGICLGAQLIADVLGGPVSRNPEPEIGWFDVTMTSEAEKYPLLAGLPRKFAAFHWHGDTFAIPPKATLLMGSEACPNQAFAIDGGRVCGLQFHLEVRAQDAAIWFQEDPPPKGRYVQDSAEILRDPGRFAANNALMLRVLERFAR